MLSEKDVLRLMCELLPFCAVSHVWVTSVLNLTPGTPFCVYSLTAVTLNVYDVYGVSPVKLVSCSDLPTFWGSLGQAFP